ncbi:hypothetical protein B0J18DRAFT_433432 [Chaetomium sp. MPI-SDFR-AT-0129]|nr:hypothetical protein B0J18DRAFT_433432 [Chaetomium sp. MPI-SDFR-AT-0129]
MIVVAVRVIFCHFFRGMSWLPLFCLTWQSRIRKPLHCVVLALLFSLPLKSFHVQKFGRVWVELFGRYRVTVSIQLRPPRHILLS